MPSATTLARKSWFGRFAKAASRFSGRPLTFAVAVALIALWGVTGPIFDFNTTWQLLVNTGTTILTFLMVILLQNTQNRDAEAIQIKLDELLRSIKGAHLALLDLEELDEDELDRIKANYGRLAERAREGLRRGERDTGAPEVEPVT